MSDERRHAPSAARLREAQQMGHFAHSYEVTAACVLLSVALVAPICVHQLRMGLVALFQSSYASPARTIHELEQLGSRVDGIGSLLESVALLAGTILCAAILGNTVQSGFRFGFRLPGNGFSLGRSSVRHVVTRTSGAALSWLRFLTCSGVCLWTCFRALTELRGWNGLPTDELATEWGRLLSALSWRLGFVLIGFAALDYLLARRRFTRSLSMTDEELRRESLSNQPAGRRQGGRPRPDRELRVHQAVEN